MAISLASCQRSEIPYHGQAQLLEDQRNGIVPDQSFPKDGHVSTPKESPKLLVQKENDQGVIWLLETAPSQEPEMNSERRRHNSTEALSSNEIGSSDQYREFDLNESLEPEELHISVNDMLKVTVWGHPELTHIAAVQNNGCITLPIVGEIGVAGKSLAESRQALTTALKAKVLDGPLMLKRMDVVRIMIWRQAELTHDAQVQMNGDLTLPLIGSIRAIDRPLEKVTQEAKERYTKFIKDPIVSILPEHLQVETLPNPVVSILPVSIEPRGIHIIGEVSNFGRQELRSNMRVMDAIAASGSLNSANLNEVLIIRQPHGQKAQYRRLKLQDYLDGRLTDQNIYLRGDDVVIVPKTAIAKVHNFIDNYFVRIMPLLDYWIRANEAINIQKAQRLAEESVEISRGYLDQQAQQTGVQDGNPTNKPQEYDINNRDIILQLQNRINQLDSQRSSP